MPRVGGIGRSEEPRVEMELLVFDVPFLPDRQFVSE